MTADSKDAIDGKKFWSSGGSGPGLLSLSSAEIVFTNMFEGGKQEKKRLMCHWPRFCLPQIQSRGQSYHLLSWLLFCRSHHWQSEGPAVSRDTDCDLTTILGFGCGVGGWIVALPIRENGIRSRIFSPLVVVCVWIGNFLGARRSSWIFSTRKFESRDTANVSSWLSKSITRIAVSTTGLSSATATCWTTETR